MSSLDSSTISNLVERVGASVVRVDAGHRWSGSGTVWNKDGIVVTAHHVIEREEGIELGGPNGSVKAVLVGVDPGTGIAVLRSEAGLSPVTSRAILGLRVGDFAVALARPGKTVRATFGIVSTLGESFRTPMGGHVDHYLEPDLDLPTGYSGGPLVDLEGRVVGINHRGVVRRGRITIPASTVDRVVTEILTHGRVRRGHLGVGVHGVKLTDQASKDAGQAHGVLVHAIEPGSNAEKAGVLQGDVILSLDGASVSSPWELATTLGNKVDIEVALKVIRAGKVIEIKSQS